MELYKKIETAYNHTTEAESIWFISNIITRYIREMTDQNNDYSIYSVAALIKANEILFERVSKTKLDTYAKEQVNAAITSLKKTKKEAERLENVGEN